MVHTSEKPLESSDPYGTQFQISGDPLKITHHFHTGALLYLVLVRNLLLMVPNLLSCSPPSAGKCQSYAAGGLDND